MKQLLDLLPAKLLAVIAIVGLVWMVDDIKGVVSPGFQDRVAEDFAAIDTELARQEGIEAAIIQNLSRIEDTIRVNDAWRNYVREKLSVLLDRAE